jgi:peptidoglycan/xylan/chitin deacetylase (PgdA/CDA1 family)
VDCIDISNVLQEFNVNAAFFINPNFLEDNQEYIDNFIDTIVLTKGKKPMRWDEIKQLQTIGHIIGAHTMDHYRINTSDTKVLNYQICLSSAHVGEADRDDHPKREQLGQMLRIGRYQRFIYPSGTRR